MAAWKIHRTNAVRYAVCRESLIPAEKLLPNPLATAQRIFKTHCSCCTYWIGTVGTQALEAFARAPPRYAIAKGKYFTKRLENLTS
jgi:hypothetical protein